MEGQETNPRPMADLLGDTFRIVKQHFSSLFLTALLFIGPIYIVNYFFMLLSGSSIFGLQRGNGSWWETIVNNVQRANTSTIVEDNLGLPGLLSYGLIIFIMSMVLYPMAQASLVVATNSLIKGEEWTITDVIKKAFSRFWPIIGSTLLFALILGGSVLVGSFLVPFLIMIGTSADPKGGFVLFIIFGLALAAVVIFLATKLSMYLAIVIFENKAPAFSESWRLTKDHFWRIAGLYIALYMIVTIVAFIVQGIPETILGVSVVSTFITDLFTLITTVILVVGYTLIYVDVRHRGDPQSESRFY